jgi:Flp pilus assembly protein TadG
MRRFRHRIMAFRSERGAALVEFALVVPFLVMIMCATIDFGLAVYTLNNLTAAVREGGRYAATMNPAPVANDALVKDRVYNYIVKLPTSQTPATVKGLITNTAPTLDAGGTYVVTVNITGFAFKPMTPLASWLGIGNIYLNRQAVFRYEIQ